MNLIDNGIEKILNIERIITDDELYFLVEFIDWYGGKKTKKFQSIKNLDKARWTE